MDSDASIVGFVSAWPLFADSALAGALCGALLGTLGVYIVLRRMVFVSAALSQTAGLGVALVFYLHLAFDNHALPPTLGAVVATCIAAWLLSRQGSGAGSRRDALLGAVYLVGAGGTLALGTRIGEELKDIEALLFGSAVVVAPQDARLVAVVGVSVLALVTWLQRGLTLASFDADGARVRGVPVRALDVALLGMIAVSTSVCTRVLGALPVLAFSVLPALVAVRHCANVPRALVAAGVVGAAVGLLGYVAAYLFALPVGAAQTLVAAGCVVMSEGARLALDLGGRWLLRRGLT